MDMDGVSVKDEGGEEAEPLTMPGFRFHPTDEELVGYYLPRQLQRKKLPVEVIKKLDIYKYDPWDLPKMSTIGEKEWYFFCPRDRKYRNSLRPNRVTASGFWKATGTDRPIYSSEGAKCIGLKKSLVFYQGRAAKGTKSDWMMHEFRLPTLSSDAAKIQAADKDPFPLQPDGWAVCRILKKTKSSVRREGETVGSISTTVTARKIVSAQLEREYSSHKLLPATKLEHESPSTGDDRITVSDVDDTRSEPDADEQFEFMESSPVEVRPSSAPGNDSEACALSEEKPTSTSHLDISEETRPSIPEGAPATRLQERSFYLKLVTAEGTSCNASSTSDSSFCSTPTSTIGQSRSEVPQSNSSGLGMNQMRNALQLTNLSPSTRNTLELVNSILLSPTGGELYERQLNGQNPMMDQCPSTSDHQTSEPNRITAGGLSVQVPPINLQFLKNISAWDLSPFFITPPVLQPFHDMYDD